ncbi:MAG: UDP-N-acetylmuramate--L-alanine ligase [Bacteroidetes bacterium]|nr:UDP-N-acetylmuramate--L-alanine ligase [Bacteroidota bacterium]
MQIEKGDKLYFLGIGGIGMSALARYFHAAGAEIHGYDKTRSIITESLENEGMVIHYTDSPELIPEDLRLAVYTPAIPKDLTEYQTLLQSGKPLMKRAEVLGTISRNIPTIAVAGTHGKTTVSSMIAHLLAQAGKPFTAFIGGIANNFRSNLVIQPNSQWLVVEADEYDRSFLQLKPHIAIVNSMDADHLDIYGSPEEMQETYRLFASSAGQGGKLIYRRGLPLSSISENSQVFALDEPADFSAQNIRVEKELFRFTIKTPAGDFETALGMPGHHNVLNALAATAACMTAGISPETIAAALPAYKGVWRRFDIIINRPDFLYVDDYAHHPEELRAAIETARNLRPCRHLTGIFQPHLFSRTRDFMDGFARSLALLDRLILLDIYPARELPIEGISSEVLLRKVPMKDKILLSPNEAIAFVKTHPTDVLMTLGAGDIDRMVEPLRKLFTE